MRNLPCCEPSDFSAAMKGSKWRTAVFMTRADFTTCGKNILPSPKSFPTTRMPSISGPSMTSKGRPSFWRASSVSATMKSSTPLTSACSIRFSVERFLHSFFLELSTSVFDPEKEGAASVSFSVACGFRFKITSSTSSLSLGSISV